MCGQPTVPTADPVPTAAPARSARRRSPAADPPPSCDCASRSRSWVELLAALDRPAVVLSGPWAADLPDPPVQRRYATAVQQAIEVDANPHLARDRHGRVWFVPKPVTSPPVGLLLPAQVSAILADPDTIIRLGRANPHTGAVDHLDEQTYRPGAKLARLVRARDGTCRYPGVRHRGRTVRPGPCHRLPARPHIGGQPADALSDASRVQAPRRLDRDHDPRRRVHLDRPQRPRHTTHPNNLHDDAA